MITLRSFLFVNERRYWRDFLFSQKKFLVKIKGFNFFVRPRTTDLFILTEVLEQQCYQPTIGSKKRKIKLVVDLGAHLGSFSVWAGKLFRPQKIIAVEVEKDNLQLLKKNLLVNRLSKKTKIIARAIYPPKVKVRLQRYGFDHGSNRLVNSKDCQEEGLETISFAALIKKNKIGKIDFLKVDIEGAEKDLLTSQNKNLFKNQVDFMMMEVHPSAGLSQEDVKKYLKDLGFRTKIRKVHLSSFLIEALKDR